MKQKIKKFAEITFFSACAIFGTFGLAKALTPKKNYISAEIDPNITPGLPEEESDKDE